MPAYDYQQIIAEGLKNLPENSLAEIADFVLFVRQKSINPQRFAEEQYLMLFKDSSEQMVPPINVHPGICSPLITCVQDLANLDAGWDGEDADVISKMALEQAQRWIIQCDSRQILLDFVAPMRDGGVQLEGKDSARNIFLEIEIDSQGKSRYLIFHLSRQTLLYKGDLSEHLDELQAKLQSCE